MVKYYPQILFVLFVFWASITQAAGDPPAALEPLQTGQHTVDYVTHFYTTDQKVKVSWDHNEPRPDGYTVQWYSVEKGVYTKL